MNSNKRFIDIDDPATPDYVVLDVNAMMAYLGVKTRVSVAQAVQKKVIPPSMHNGHPRWTVGQVREWRILRGRIENAKAIQKEIAFSGLSAAAATSIFDRALAVLPKDPPADSLAK